MASSDIIVNQGSFWVGIIGASLTLIWLLTIRVNKRSVFQSKIGNRSLQSDKMVVGSILALAGFLILTSAGFGYVQYSLILIPLLVIVILLRNPEIAKPLWRGTKKIIKNGVTNFFNLLSSIFKGVTRRK